MSPVLAAILAIFFRCGRSLAERAPSFAYAASSRVNLALSYTIPLVKFKLSLDEYDTPNRTIWQCAFDHRAAISPLRLNPIGCK